MLQIPQIVPAVWVYTTAPAFNEIRPEGFASFLSKDQAARLERIRQSRMLFDGLHRKYFIDEGRTQFNFPPERAAGVWGEKTIRPYKMMNLLKLISLKNADLLFGETPMLSVQLDDSAAPDDEDPASAVLRVQNDTQRQQLTALVDRSSLHALFHSKAVDASYEGEAFLESCVQDGEVYLQDIPTDEIFPVGKMGADFQFQQYLRMQVRNIGTEKQPIYLLLKITYFAGRIERHLWQLDENGKPMPRELSLDQWPLEVGETPLVPLTTTGIDENTVTYVPNQLSRGAPISDYDGLIDLQDGINAKETQLDAILYHHSSPKIMLPSRMANEQGGFRTDHDVIFYDETNPDAIAKYLTWNSEAASAISERDAKIEHMCIMAEMAPSLLGLQKKVSARAASFKALKLESYSPLTKAQRKSMYQKQGIKRAIRVCQKLENTLPGVRYEIEPIGVDLKDGIPIDELDQANRISILVAAGVMSQKRAVEEQLPDPAASLRELQELERENAAKQSSIVIGEATGGPGQLEQAPPGNEEQAAEAAVAESEKEVAA